MPRNGKFSALMGPGKDTPASVYSMEGNLNYDDALKSKLWET